MIVHSFDYPPMPGGTAQLCGEIALGLQRRGWAVRVLSQAAGPGPDRRVPELVETRVTARRPWREWQALWRLREARTAARPVICGTWYPEGLLAVLAGIRPLVILAHGNELLPAPCRWRRGLWRWLSRVVLTAADLVVASSDDTRRLVRAAAPGSRVAAIPPPDDGQALARILRRIDQDPVGFRAARREARVQSEREGTWEQYLERFETALEAGGVIP